MSRCDNCIYLDCNDDGMCRCMKGNIVVMVRKDCDDFEHWNKVSGDGV